MSHLKQLIVPISSMHGPASDPNRGDIEVGSRAIARFLGVPRLLEHHSAVGSKVGGRVEHGMLRMYKNNNNCRVDTLW